MASIRQRIVPHLWYDKEAAEAARFYATVFPESKVTSVNTIHDTPSGDAGQVSLRSGGSRSWRSAEVLISS